jgi:hypothetical protein
MISFSKEIPNADLRILSLGAGVQSSVMALMADKGQITPMPDCAIFADTMDEPDEVYEHLDWLVKQLQFPVHIVSEGSLKDSIVSGQEKWGYSFCVVPFHQKSGFGKRQCTKQYKIDPIRKKNRQLLGYEKGQKITKKIVEQWIGISTDEMQRVKDSRDKWVINRYPLLEKGLKRYQCQQWFEEHYPKRNLPRSACVYCPYKRNDEWRYLRDYDPKGWQEAINVDHLIRNSGNSKEEQFVHNSCVPLEKADLSTAEDKGQLNFLDECDGMCGM